MPKTYSWAAIIFAVSAPVVAFQLPSVTPDVTYAGVLERLAYIDLRPLDLTEQQTIELHALSSEWEEKLGNARATGVAVEFRRSQNPAIESRLKEILTSWQLEYLVMDRNISLIASEANRRSQSNSAGAFLGTETLQRLLGLTAEQRELIKAKEDAAYKSIQALREKLAMIEDELETEYTSQLVGVLESEQKNAYSDLIGVPAVIAKKFKSLERLKNDPPYPSSPPSIVAPPQDLKGPSEKELEVLARKLVLIADLNGDLELSPGQTEQWKTTKKDLEAAIKPHTFSQVVNLLETPRTLVKLLEPSNYSEIDSSSVDLATALELALAASVKTYDLLLESQKQWLRQVALQYYVGMAGAKFPLRYSLIRRQIKLTATQEQLVSDFLADHDERLNDEAQKIAAQDRQIRQDLEIELYEILTTDQKRTLAKLIGPPKSQNLPDKK